jgi:hypothetical protein
VVTAVPVDQLQVERAELVLTARQELRMDFLLVQITPTVFTVVVEPDLQVFMAVVAEELVDQVVLLRMNTQCTVKLFPLVVTAEAVEWEVTEVQQLQVLVVTELMEPTEQVVVVVDQVVAEPAAEQD